MKVHYWNRLHWAWIVNPRHDLFFFIGSIFFSLFFYLVYLWFDSFPVGHPLYFYSIALTHILFTAVFDYPHIFQTFSRTHHDRAEFKKRKILFTWGLLFLILFGFFIFMFEWEEIFLIFLSGYGAWHIFKQNTGFLKLYKRVAREKNKTDSIIDFGSMTLVFITCLSVSCGRRLEGMNFLVAYEPFLKSIFWIVVGCFFIRQCYLGIFQGGFSPVKCLFVLSIFFISYFVYIYTYLPLPVMVAVETTYHDIQYQGWIIHYQEQRFKPKKIVFSWLKASCLYGFIYAVVWFLSMTHRQFAILSWPFTMIVFFHYYVDGLIWRSSEDPWLKNLIKN